MNTTLIRLLLLISTTTFVQGQHGSTATFKSKIKALSEERIALVIDTKLKFEWVEDGDSLSVIFEDSKGLQRICCRTGNKLEDADEDSTPSYKITKPEEMPNPGKSGLKSPDGTHTVSISKDGQSISLGNWSTQPEEGFVWKNNIRWSPDSNHFIAFKVADISVRKVTYVRSAPKDQLQPKTFDIDYPKPGDELKVPIPVVFQIDGDRIEVDGNLIPNPFSLTNVRWCDDNRLWFEYIARGFTKYRLLELDVRTGKTRVLAAEENDKFVHVYGNCGWWYLDEEQILWLSERTGYNQLYRIDTQTGQTQQLTQEPGLVRDVLYIKDGRALIKYAGYHQDQDPYQLHYAWLDCETGALTRLTSANGTHKLHFSPDLSYYVAEYSRADLPPVYDLHRSNDGTKITNLARADLSKRLAVADQHPIPVLFSAKDRDDKYHIHGFILFPPDHDSSKKYPVVEMIYAGPHGSFTPKHWRSWQGTMAEMAAHGFIVVKLDGRGTNHRGREFQQYAHKNLRDSGLPDRIKWMRAAALEHPSMDLSRVGIYGGSAGGQSSLAALIWHGDFYKAAAADCGCHDNRMDKIWWNEQWMGWPVDESYAENSNVEHVEKMEGALFLTVGEVDTNVDPSSTLQVVDALIQADKDFEFYLVPNAKHGIGEHNPFKRRRIQFFQRALQSGL